MEASAIATTTSYDIAATVAAGVVGLCILIASAGAVANLAAWLWRNLRFVLVLLALPLAAHATTTPREPCRVVLLQPTDGKFCCTWTYCCPDEFSARAIVAAYSESVFPERYRKWATQASRDDHDTRWGFYADQAVAAGGFTVTPDLHRWHAAKVEKRVRALGIRVAY